MKILSGVSWSQVGDKLIVIVQYSVTQPLKYFGIFTHYIVNVVANLSR